MRKKTTLQEIIPIISAYVILHKATKVSHFISVLEFSAWIVADCLEGQLQPLATFGCYCRLKIRFIIIIIRDHKLGFKGFAMYKKTPLFKSLQINQNLVLFN